MLGVSLSRNPITENPFVRLPESLQSELRCRSDSLIEFRPVSLDKIFNTPDILFDALHHQLSASFMALNGVQPFCRRSRNEQRVLARFADKLGERCENSIQTFNQRLGVLNFELTVGLGGWRTGDIGMNRDALGNTIRFPSTSIISAQMNLLNQTLINADGLPAIFIATMSLVILTNCHPFRDGNGRVGRVLFNYALRQGGMPKDVYIPFHEIAVRSNGGYQIALRQAEIHGEWEPLFKYVCKVLDLHRVLQSAKSR